MVQALHYKPEGHGFDSPCCHNFSFQLHCGPAVDSASNRNEYQEYLVQRADNLTTFMLRMSWNLAVSNSWSPQGLSRPVRGWLYLLLKWYHKDNHTNSKLITMLTEAGGSLSWLKPQYPLRLLCSIIWKATTLILVFCIFSALCHYLLQTIQIHILGNKDTLLFYNIFWTAQKYFGENVM